MTASTIIDKIAPQYAADTDKAFFILEARNQTDRCFYGNNYEKAVALRAAHMMALRDFSQSQVTLGSGGEIASKREGDLSISFHKSSSNGNTQDDLSLTNYGRQLQGLRAGSSPFMTVISKECNNGCNS